jgi:hypothetical protein
MKKTKFKCIICGKLTSGRIPRQGREIGDRSLRYPRKHKVNGKPCKGNLYEAEWVDIEIKTKEG